MIRSGFIAGLVVLLAGCGDPAEEWIQDGFMYGISQEKWNEASGRQRIGTAGFWLKQLNDKDLLIFEGVEASELKPQAIELSQCINELVEKGVATNKEAQGQALVCLNLLGWLKRQ